jgi:NAD+ synthase (glutamine-hydrolysing)
MKHIRFGVGVLNQTPFDWEGNDRRIREAIEEARDAGVSVLCLPELCITGYGCEDMFHAPALLAEAWDRLESLATETDGMVVSVGLPVELRGAIYNCAAMLVDGKIEGLVAKRFLAGDGLHYEPRWFKPWPSGEVTTLHRGKDRYPFGDLIFEVGGLLFGFEICEDAWVAARPGSRLSLQGIDVIMNPSASHFAFGKQDIRRRLVLEGSRAFGVTYLYANLLGNEAGRIVYDGGGMVASAGSLFAETTRFSFSDVGIAHALIDVSFTRLQRARTASFQPEPRDEAIYVDFDYPDLQPEPFHRMQPTDYSKEEAFARVIALALFDYLRKARAQGYVVSLSGGADSAACACLVRIMVDMAVAELGVEGAKARLGHVANLEHAQDADQMTRQLLTTAYQSTRNSGEVTRNAAKVVAEAIAADHYELDVDALVEGYVALVEKSLDRDLTWESDDIALQNIQARVRAPSIWLIANARSQILIATSNRSEAAVGYATMDGDTAGGISPIAGIDKAFLRQWLKWLESVGAPAIGPFPELRAVNDQQPTAELRPAEEDQTDEGDLMPYPVLDAIERVAIRDKKFPGEAFAMMRVEFPDVPETIMRGWVAKFYQLWCRNQWKRERYAASFHVDDKNLDPKTWCRFPILSGGYALELDELKRRGQKD